MGGCPRTLAGRHPRLDAVPSEAIRYVKPVYRCFRRDPLLEVGAGAGAGEIYGWCRTKVRLMGGAVDCSCGFAIIFGPD
jgi:hypothetical protein